MQEQPSITGESLFFPLGQLYAKHSLLAILNNLNGRKDRTRLILKKDEAHDGVTSEAASRASSPDLIKEASSPLSAKET